MKHTVVESPMFSEMQMFADENKYLKEALDNKEITVVIRNNTKKSLYVSLKYKQLTVGVNLDIPGFKTKHEEGHSILSGRYQHAYYFKIIKSQGLPELRSYVEKILENIFTNYVIPEDFNCKWEATKTFKDLFNGVLK